MKKVIISSVLGVALAASTAFGQGYIAFAGASRTVWNDTGSTFISATNTPVNDSGFDATFLWSASSSTSPMTQGSVATNNSTAYSYSGAWTQIEGASSSGWTAAATGGAGVIGAPANNLGGFSYSAGSAFALDGSTGSGQVINIYVIGWETQGGLYTTLASAESAGAPVGWSSVFSYTLGSGPPATPPASTTVPKFGIGAPVPSPEPTTLALAGLGGLSMIFLRRKKA